MEKQKNSNESFDIENQGSSDDQKITRDVTSIPNNKPIGNEEVTNKVVEKQRAANYWYWLMNWANNQKAASLSASPPLNPAMKGSQQTSSRKLTPLNVANTVITYHPYFQNPLFRQIAQAGVQRILQKKTA